MRTLKLTIVLILMALCTVAYSSEAALSFNEVMNSDPEVKPELSREIGRLLRESELVFEEETKVVLIFYVTSEKKILIRSIFSRDTAVKSFLQTRLENRKLHDSSWQKGEVYVVPLKLEVRR